MTTTILIILNVFTALAIIGLTLMQQSKGDMGSAFGGGGSQSMFGSRGSANFLSRSTSVMCALFFISSLALAYVYAQRADLSSSVLDSSVIEAPADNSVLPTIDDSVPSIPGIENIPDDADTSVPSIPAIDGETVEPQGFVPVTPDTAVPEVIQEAVDAVESSVPDVPE